MAINETRKKNVKRKRLGKTTPFEQKAAPKMSAQMRVKSVSNG